MGRLIATKEGSRANSPSRRSAGGQDEQPWLVNNSTTARGSAPAEAPIASDATAVTRAGNRARRRRFIFEDSPPSPAMPTEADKGIMAGAFPRPPIRGGRPPAA